MEITLSGLAALVDGQIRSGEPDFVLTGVAALDTATDTDLSFFGNEKYLRQLRETAAGAVLVPEGFPEKIVGPALIEVRNPSAAFADVMKKLSPPPPTFVPGVHPSAVVDPSANFDPAKVSIHPLAVIGADVVIGDGTEIGAGSVIGSHSVIGENGRLMANVTVSSGTEIGDRVRIHSGVVIGGDGFGYELVDGIHQKIDQIGTVEIGDDVEIGANSTIDRARFGKTRIGDGTKIDNLVQIGHNAVIGKHCIIVALTGIAGSVRVGDYVTMAAQVGIAGHLEIADHVVLGARAGVTKSITEPGFYMGYPAQPAKDERRMIVRSRQLPTLFDRVQELEGRQ